MSYFPCARKSIYYISKTSDDCHLQFFVFLQRCSFIVNCYIPSFDWLELAVFR